MNHILIHRDRPKDGFAIDVYFFEELNIVAKCTRISVIEAIPKAPPYDCLTLVGGTVEQRTAVKQFINKLPFN